MNNFIENYEHLFDIFWIIGSIIVAAYMIFIVVTDNYASRSFRNLSVSDKIVLIIELSFISILGSWLLILYQIILLLYYKFRKFLRRK